jgi:hemerythrin-like domain-containing protein
VVDHGDMEATPDLSHFFAIHRKMRVDLARFIAAVEVANACSPSERLSALAAWATGFGHELHAHHTSEDNIVFDDLAARVPSVQPLLADLGRDHDRVAELLLEFGPAAAILPRGTRPFDEAKSALLSTAIELRDLLARHLDIEDEDVLPLFAEHYTASEYDALTERVAKAFPKKGLLFSIPWNIAAQSPETREQLIAEAPAVLRLVFRFANVRYQRLVAAAFAGIPEPTTTTTSARSYS